MTKNKKQPFVVATPENWILDRKTFAQTIRNARKRGITVKRKKVGPPAIPTVRTMITFPATEMAVFI